VVERYIDRLLLAGENIEAINIDDTGVGGGLVDFLQENTKIGHLVNPIVFSKASPDPRFSGYKSYIVYKIASLIKMGKIKFRYTIDKFARERLIYEATASKIEFTSEGKLNVLDPGVIRVGERLHKSGKRSPDFLHSLALALSETKTSIGYVGKIRQHIYQQRGGDIWAY
jgi:hypothetical protein